MMLADELRIDLLALQGDDGGFAAGPGAPPNLEATAYAALCTSAAPAERARAWLRSQQRAQGGFAFSPEVAELSWATALALLALAEAPPEANRPALRAGAAWLVARRGTPFSLWVRFLQLLVPKDQRVDQDLSLEGWPWNASAQSWVEPTAFSIIALRKTLRLFDAPGARERIAEGEALLLDRVCPGGGWNYGNKRVLDFQLEPFPDETAIALLALRPSQAADRLSESVARLERLLESQQSGLALSLGTLALDAYQRDATRFRDALEARYRATRFRREARSLALAILALEHRSELFSS